MKHITANSRKQLILENLKKTGEIKISELAAKFANSRKGLRTVAKQVIAI